MIFYLKNSRRIKRFLRSAGFIDAISIRINSLFLRQLMFNFLVCLTDKHPTYEPLRSVVWHHRPFFHLRIRGND
nr:MAG TPA: hypothetical protein [Caudoviricetes sp.]